MNTDVRFNHPLKCIISGPTGSGNLNFCVWFPQNLRYLFTEHRYKGSILSCLSEWNSIPTKQLKALKLNIRYHE